MRGTGLLIYDSCNSHLTSPVKDLLYTNGIALAVIPRGMTLALQFLDLYFFAYFKRLYADEIDSVLETVQGKLSASEKRIIMTNCVAAAWKKASDQLPIERLFRELGYIWSNEGASLKIPVLKDYKYNPELVSPSVRVPLTAAEQREKALMAQEDTLLCRPAIAAPPKSLKQAKLSFKRG